MANMSRAQSWSLTEHLLSTRTKDYKAATQAPFLLAAAQGRLTKEILGKWLANDRLYIHSYIKAAGKLLHAIDLPQHVPDVDVEPFETKLVDWLIEALAAVRKEERLFLDVARRYGLEMDMGTLAKAMDKAMDEPKVPGLALMDDLFKSVPLATAQDGLIGTKALDPSPKAMLPWLPWLEGAVTFWGTERCYLDAWSWARSRQAVSAEHDADGGALRTEFIPNWSSPEFGQFVGRLAAIIDEAVAREAERRGEEVVKKDVLSRVEPKWRSLLIAEAAFWPVV